MTVKQKRKLARILAAAVLFVVLYFIPLEGMWRLFAYLVPYLVVGWDILWKAIRNIVHGEIFDENFLMSVASVGAFAVGEYPEAVAVMLFDQVGELFEDYAVGKSRKSISSLMNIRPDYANVERDGAILEVSPDEVGIGDTIIIKAGEKIPLDGVVLEGTTTVDTAALTGESLPRDIAPGDDVISGCINLTGLVRVRVTKAFSESTVSKILDLVENASSKKAKTETFISKFSKYYTPCVVAAALLLAVVPPLFDGLWSTWVYRALTFLVISCPCALVISVPLSFFGGIGGASKCGILVKGGNYMEALSRCEIVVFDKTGTLTKGVFNVTAVHPEKATEEELIEYAALAETYSDHPIAKSIKEVYGMDIDTSRIASAEELSGRGVVAVIDGHRIAVGGDKLMTSEGAAWHPCHRIGTTVHVARDGEYLGHIVISDEIKSDAADAVRLLKEAGVRKTVMLTGDADEVGRAVADALDIDEAYTKLLPADKVEKVEGLLKEKSKKGVLAFVGDGINDAPVLSRADVGIAMGAMGSDAAIEASDIVLMDDKPSKIATAIRIAKRTIGIAHINILFALAVKALILILGAFGIADMWAAVFADVGVSVIAILNSMRALSVKKYRENKAIVPPQAEKETTA